VSGTETTAAPSPESAAGHKFHVLVAEDEPTVARSLERYLTGRGFHVTVARNGREAIERAATERFDAIVSDVRMPEVDGRAVLRAVRARDLDVPFVFLTGDPDIESAIEAVQYGAFRYLLKPVNVDELAAILNTATSWHRLARIRRESAGEDFGTSAWDRAGLEARLASAIEKIWMAMQPIVSWGNQSLLAYEALVRTDEQALRSPAALFQAAERLGRTRELGRAIRRQVATRIPAAPPSALVFVNVHPSDLEDPEFGSRSDPLAPFADRVVLEITERAALDEIPALGETVTRLRSTGFKIAIDDLGAGYAGLSSFAALEPDVVKADMSLVRDIERSAVKRKLVASMVALCADLRIQLVAEGIETAAERDCLVSLGCDALQGYLFARPDRGFPDPKY
jgi:EAL domain-containing protein (putative c-di-GMP-specific phosphodiesterase class I)/ActR/RegA family two-component response regulator